jgi:hypothetical protein
MRLFLHDAALTGRIKKLFNEQPDIVIEARLKMTKTEVTCQVDTCIKHNLTVNLHNSSLSPGY